MIRAMRKTLILSAFCLLLTACGGDGEVVACDNGYWDGNIGVCLPDGWHIVDRAQLDERGVSPEVAVAFQSDAPYSGQFATVTVTRESLPQEMTPEEYSEASILSVQTLPGYTEIDLVPTTIDESEVSIHEYTAQPRDDKPESRFYQLSTVSSGIGYSLTGATPVSVPDELDAMVTDILSSLTFISPDGEQPAGE